MRIPKLGLVLLFILGHATTGFAQEKLTRDQMVLQDRQQMVENSKWIYDDFAEAKSNARQESKPMMVVLRCIP